MPRSNPYERKTVLLRPGDWDRLLSICLGSSLTPTKIIRHKVSQIVDQHAPELEIIELEDKADD